MSLGPSHLFDRGEGGRDLSSLSAVSLWFKILLAVDRPNQEEDTCTLI